MFGNFWAAILRKQPISYTLLTMTTESFMNFLSLVSKINSVLWGGPMLFLLFGTHLYFTIHLKFIQRKTGLAIRLSFQADSDHAGNPSIFSTLATTLAATLGTGNIVGVSTAIALGGPGALFWCWITGVFGMATTYAECYLGIRYRRRLSDGSYCGGPMYALEDGLGWKKTAHFFAFCTILTAFFMGCQTQSHSVADAAAHFGVPDWLAGMILAVIVGLAVIGGASSIQKICTYIVPGIAAFYLFGCLILFILNRHFLFPALSLIVTSAFCPKAVISGFAGMTIQKALRYGISRGLFTNEAGLGSASIAAASSSSTDLKKQALVSMSATFWDTVVMCAITGLVIVSTVVKDPSAVSNLSYSEWTNAAFSQIPYIGSPMLQLSLIAFGAATLIGWSFFGEKAIEYLFGKTHQNLYRFFYLIMIFLGAILSLDTVWECTDFINLCMTLPNLLALFFLRKEIKS